MPELAVVSLELCRDNALTKLNRELVSVGEVDRDLDLSAFEEEQAASISTSVSSPELGSVVVVLGRLRFRGSRVRSSPFPSRLTASKARSRLQGFALSEVLGLFFDFTDEEPVLREPLVEEPEMAIFFRRSLNA